MKTMPRPNFPSTLNGGGGERKREQEEGEEGRWNLWYGVVSGQSFDIVDAIHSHSVTSRVVGSSSVTCSALSFKDTVTGCNSVSRNMRLQCKDDEEEKKKKLAFAYDLPKRIKIQKTKVFHVHAHCDHVLGKKETEGK